MPRYAAKVDSTQKAIVRFLRMSGDLVLILGGTLDLIVQSPQGRQYAVDCKGVKGTKTKAQQKLEALGFTIVYLHSIDDAVEWRARRR